MEITIDYRENKLIELIENIHKNSFNKEASKITLKVSNLLLGDVSLKMNVNKSENNIEESAIIIERKSISDLLSSITDGRYKEQSYRLQNCSIHNHNIIYLIEGNIDTHKQYFASKQNAHLQYYSSLFSLYYYKGFSVFMTHSIEQTASMIYHFALKIVRSHKKYVPHFLNIIQPVPTQELTNNIQDTVNSSNDDSDLQYEYDNNSDLNYLQCIKSEKKQNITRDNIWQIMLMQVPYVSDKIASSLLEYYDNVPNLVYELQQDPDCLNNFKIVDSNGKARKLSSKVITNIFELLV